QGDAVGDDDLTDGGIAQPVDSGAAEHGVRGTGVNLAGAVELGDIGGADHAPGGRDHVVEDDRDFFVQRAADQVRLLCFRGTGAPLVDNGNGAADLLLVQQSTLDAPLVRAQHHQVARRDAQVAHVLVDDRAAVQV